MLHISEWTACNNLRLNVSKSCVMQIHRRPVEFPHNLALVTRRNNDNLEGNHSRQFEHLNTRRWSFGACSQSLYALHVLRSHALTDAVLHDMARATTVACLFYAAPAWWALQCQQKEPA